MRILLLLKKGSGVKMRMSLIYKRRMNKIINYYNIDVKAAKFLSYVDEQETEDWKEFENHMVTLHKLCQTSEELEEAKRCLLDRLEI